jgi:HlyD family secretion protein
MKKALVLLIIVLVIVGVVVVIAASLYISRSRQSSDVIKVSGNIEVTDVQVSFKIPGRVEVRLVDEGEMAGKGEVVARLDTSDLEQQVAIKEAEVESARAVLAELEAGSRPQEIREAAAVVQEVEADLLDAKVNYERTTRLWKEKSAGYQEYISAQARYDGAQAKLREVKERYDLIREGPRKEAIEQARGQLGQARASLELARVQLGYAILTSPLNGVVLSDNIESGEYVQPGTPILTIGDLVNVWLRVYINETDLGRVKLGQKVRVSTDTWPGKFYEGRVSFISSEAEFTPKNVQTEEERVKLVYRMKIDIHNPEMELKPGMPADAWIDVNESQ